MNTESKHCCGEILKHGYLRKKSGVLKKWKLGYFALGKDCLSCYHNEKEWEEGIPKEIIFFNDISVYILDILDTQPRYCIKIVKKTHSNKMVHRKTHLFSCFCEEERNKWLSEILYAKAITFIRDPNECISIKQKISKRKSSNGESSSSSSEVEGGSVSQGVLKRHRRKSWSGAGPRDPTSWVNLYQLTFSSNSSTRTPTVNLDWKNKVML